ncbi:MAG: ABC-F family ATP-binding cassette domain-containing protein, partial [Proteobacteria bacterium]|nr:ABC-F family ATP-binding cassette domain-containing protein [Pseudomonadota bacterium]
MQPLLQCLRVSHAMGTRTLFRDIDLTINTGDRIGLVGHNGSGKSTLLSILTGKEEPDQGDIARNRDLHLSVVEQFIDPALNPMTLLDALTDRLPLEDQLARRHEAEALLVSLGFEEREFGHRVEDLSGGQQNRLMFARATILMPNLILFDEPTNHLDLKTLVIFENCLRSMNAAFLVISHDREFLDSVTDQTVFLRDERLYHFSLPYSAARQALDEQDAAALAAREQEEKQIRRLEASAHRLAQWGKVYDNEKIARKAKNMEKRIERMRDEQTFVSRGSGLKLELDVGSAQANRMLHIEQCDITAPDGTRLLHIEDMMIRPGDRVALLGHNGAGKTTLINRIMNQYKINPEGDGIRFNPRCDIGYYDQELQRLDPAFGLTETLREQCGGPDSALTAALIKAGFPYQDLDKKVAVLSGGERARLMFLIMRMNQPNFLILDEPTNHIDIQGKEELEHQILESKATVIITSHDRRFVENIAQRYLLIAGGQLTEINTPAAFYRSSIASQPTTTPSSPSTGPSTL